MNNSIRNIQLVAVVIVLISTIVAFFLEMKEMYNERDITLALMTDARFSGGSVGLVIGHVGPEAALGGPIALVEEGDTIEANLNTNELNCVELQDKETFLSREKKWKDEVEKNNGIHPLVGEVDTRLLARMRNLAVSAVY